ncbi:DNA polymerase beta subunit [Vibrio phage VpKK5]|uniref:DNA polymerase processivity factor n=1 Tax=Vibrio phage VpKK5 TaxID=1538804 RepID=UPI0004F64938|nr:DNA polymerase processivity factor [Vibrio phage VpKK5]AIM40619.1 DNA polymerase beta subunit [Vibrio phage VpKK5]
MADLLKTLKFVQGAVARKDFVAALTHFRIKDNQIIGYNGKMALGGPIDIELNVTPKATPLVKAIATCKDTVAMHMTKAGRLAIKSGKFKAYIDCTEEVFPEIEPEGVEYEMPPGFLESVKQLAPYMAEDASRPWAAGMLFRGTSIFATNNIVIVEKWVGEPFPVEVNVPRYAIKELLRIKEDPIKIQMTESSITFHFEGGRWLRSQISTLDWPDIGRVLDIPSQAKTIDHEFFDLVEQLIPFTDDQDRVYFKGDVMTTHLEDELGSSFDHAGLPTEGVFKAKQLASLNGLATHIDFNNYPAPCPFFGDKLRGAIIGMRD